MSILAIVVTMTSFLPKKLGFTTVRIMKGLGKYQPEDREFHFDYQIEYLSELRDLLVEVESAS